MLWPVFWYLFACCCVLVVCCVGLSVLLFSHLCFFALGSSWVLSLVLPLASAVASVCSCFVLFGSVCVLSVVLPLASAVVNVLLCCGMV